MLPLHPLEPTEPFWRREAIEAHHVFQTKNVIQEKKNTSVLLVSGKQSHPQRHRDEDMIVAFVSFNSRVCARRVSNDSII